MPLTVMMRPDAYFQSVKVNDSSVMWGWQAIPVFDDEFIEIKGSSSTLPSLISRYYGIQTWMANFQIKVACIQMSYQMEHT